MKLSELPPAVLAGRLGAGRLLLDIGPFVARVCSPLPALAQGLRQAYRDFDLAPQQAFADFDIALRPAGRRRAAPRGQPAPARFYLDSQAAAPPAAADALLLLEQGLNGCIAARAHQFLILDAAVVERSGCALLLVAPADAAPGQHPSALCAALVHHGWRLLSDRLALLAPDSGLLWGMARPLQIDAAALPALQRLLPRLETTAAAAPNAATAPALAALACPPTDSVLRRREPAWPGWVVEVQHQPGAATGLRRAEPAQVFTTLAAGSPNYRLHGLRGFRGLGQLLDHSGCHRLVYADLGAALQALDQLADDGPCPSARHC